MENTLPLARSEKCHPRDDTFLVACAPVRPAVVVLGNNGKSVPRKKPRVCFGGGRRSAGAAGTDAEVGRWFVVLEV